MALKRSYTTIDQQRCAPSECLAWRLSLLSSAHVESIMSRSPARLKLSLVNSVQEGSCPLNSITITM